jgi:adenylate cyclase
MAQEIERKFLLAHDGWRTAVSHHEAMRQGYLAASPQCSIRIRIADKQAFLNLKSATLGVSRHEFEYPVPVDEAREMFTLFCADRCLDKVRYYVPQGPHIWEIDVFEGQNAGLVVAEIELTSADEDFVRPSWLGREVSDDPRYYNSCLIDHPYLRW